MAGAYDRIERRKVEITLELKGDKSRTRNLWPEMNVMMFDQDDGPDYADELRRELRRRLGR